MSNVTKIIAAVVALVTLVLQSDAAQAVVGGFIGSHPNIAAIVAGIAAILALVHKPQA
jgi:hypothetical protein